MHNTRTQTRNPSFLVKPDPNPTRSQKALLVKAWSNPLENCSLILTKINIREALCFPSLHCWWSRNLELGLSQPMRGRLSRPLDQSRASTRKKSLLQFIVLKRAENSWLASNQEENRFSRVPCKAKAKAKRLDWVHSNAKLKKKLNKNVISWLVTVQNQIFLSSIIYYSIHTKEQLELSRLQYSNYNS